MNPLIQPPKTTLVFLVALACFGLSPSGRAVSPPPDGCYPNFTTAEGCNALQNLVGGAGNTGLGWFSLFADVNGSFNTAVGAGTLVLNQADSNTAVGTAALFLNTFGGGQDTGTENTAVGTAALVSNTGGALNFSGSFNDAVGAFALNANVDGLSNNAFGDRALFSNIHGNLNTAIGDLALMNNDSTGTGDGSLNTAVGAGALFSNTDGGFNNAVGASALENNTTGTFNQAMGAFALDSNQDGESNVAIGDTVFADNVSGSFNTIIGELAGAGVEGDDNIYIGATAGLPGGGSESATIRIGDASAVSACYIAGIVGQTATGGSQVFIDADGKLGTLTSSSRFKEHIRPMDKASETLFALKPVTFCYKKEIDAKGTPQFGLVAEEVAKVNPTLVINDRDGKPYTVRYEAVNAMLLNEFLKAHRKLEEQEKTISQLKSTIVQQMEAVTARLKEHDAQIRQVNAQVEWSRPAPRTVADNQ